MCMCAAMSQWPSTFTRPSGEFAIELSLVHSFLFSLIAFVRPAGAATGACQAPAPWALLCREFIFKCFAVVLVFFLSLCCLTFIFYALYTSS